MQFLDSGASYLGLGAGGGPGRVRASGAEAGGREGDRVGKEGKVVVTPKHS